MEEPRRPYKLRSPVLRRHGLAVARSCFERIYRTWPELDERYGERGRRHTAQDNFWHLDYLDSAVAADAPEAFAEYTDWLVGLLTARGLAVEHVAGTYGFLAEALACVDCSRRLEAHRRTLVALLEQNRDRVLAGSLGPATSHKRPRSGGWTVGPGPSEP